MRKSLSLMLTAMLTCGSVLQSSAAPLAKKDAAKTGEPSKVAQAYARESKGLKVNLPLTRSLKAAEIKGIHKVSSELKSKNRSAFRSATAASRAVANKIDLRGHAVYGDSWMDEGVDIVYGIYSLPKSTGAPLELIGETSESYSYGCVDTGNGVLYGVSYVDFMGIFQIIKVDKINTEDWSVISSQSASYDAMATASALDPTTGQIYGIFYQPEGESLKTYWGTADWDNVTHNNIAPCSYQLMGLGADKNGQFYGIGVDGVAYKIDKATGEFTKLSETNIPYQYLVGGCYNDDNNTFLQTWNTDADGGGLCEVNLQTGETTIISKFPDNEEVVSPYIAKPAAEDKAPAAPSLAVACVDGAMTVTATIEMPDALFDGTPLAADAELSYTLTANGEVVKEGKAKAGAELTETVELTESGMVEFVLTASNATGVSPKAKASCYVGKGTPSAPAMVALEYAAGTANLSWTAVTTAADEGFFDGVGVTYNVLDLEGAKVAEGLTATSATFTVAEPAEGLQLLGYQVVAVYAGKSSAPTASNKLTLGSLAVPMSMDLGDAANFDLHTILDVNADGRTWSYDATNSVVRYNYSGANEADDWLFSPGVKLEAGKAYPVSAIIGNNSNTYTEKIAIAIGQGANAEAMTTELLPATDITGGAQNSYEIYFTPTVSGVYNVGFHALSPKNQYFLYLYSYSVGAGVSSTAPDAVTNAEVKGASNGDLKAAITFKAPEKALDGSALSSVTVKVKCGDRLVKEVSGKAGTSYSIEDQVEAEGNYTYTFEPVNAAGEAGKLASVTAYIGPKPASPVSNINAVEVSATSAKLTWDPVTTDEDGNTIPASNVTYTIWSVADGYLDEVLAEGITATEYTLTYEPYATQDFVQWGVQAVNRGKGGKVAGAGCVVGPAYELPVSYTGQSSLDQMLVQRGDGQVQLGDSSLGVDAFDGDNSYFAIANEYLDDATGIEFGKVNFACESPVVTFYLFKVADNDINEVEVSVIVEGQESLVATIKNADLVADQWNKCKVALTPAKGKVGQVVITGVTKSHKYVLVDAITMANDVDFDLSASIAAPAKVEMGKEFNVTVTVANEGAKKSGAYSVDLIRDGQIVATEAAAEGIDADGSKSFTFAQTLGIEAAAAKFQAIVSYEDDMNPDNNESEVVTVARALSSLPAPANLNGEQTEAGTTLTWDAIDTANPLPVEKTEDFEGFESWAQELEGWTLIDGDGTVVGGFEGLPIPGIEAGVSTAGFFLFDNTDDAFNQTFDAHSGNKYLAAMFLYDGSACDDWVISPALTGDAQTVSFFAKSYSGSYPEKIEVLYTTGTADDVDSYTQVKVISAVPQDWTEVTFDVPAGATHFAIRSCAADAFMLMIDDITFKQSGKIDATLLGYNVYCDGKKVNNELLTEPKFVHDDAAPHVYNVTAVYDKGESEFSAPWGAADSGLDSVLAGQVKVSTDGRAIVVAGAEAAKVVIASVDGKVLYNGVGDARVNVAPAIYLVAVDGKTVKVIVR